MNLIRSSFLIAFWINLFITLGLAADKILQENGQVTDSFVQLLGWTGVRIANDPIHPNPQWPEAKIILPSRRLTDIIPTINGDLDPQFSWRQKPNPTSNSLPPPERWEMMGNFSKKQAEMIIDICLNDLGLKSRISPRQKHYQGVLFLGAALPRVRTRLAFLNGLVDHQEIDFTKIYILTGERPLSKAAGETSQCLIDRHNNLLSIHPEWQPPKVLPHDEGDMIKMVFDQSKHPHLKEDQIALIYTPKRKGEARATTETTVFKWLEQTQPKDGLYLAISNQPYVLYQELVIRRCLLQAKRHDIQIECVGPQADFSGTPPSSVQQQAAVLLDNLNRICYELRALQELKEK